MNKSKAPSSTRNRPPSNQDQKGTAKGDEKKKPTELNPVLKAVIRPIMSVRKLRVNYSENMTTTVPGFTPKSRLLGMSSGFGAPGWDFIAGLQPDIHRRTELKDGDWLADARDNGWITTNPFQNLPVDH